jgi:hypothetical protein
LMYSLNTLEDGIIFLHVFRFNQSIYLSFKLF